MYLYDKSEVVLQMVLNRKGGCDGVFEMELGWNIEMELGWDVEVQGWNIGEGVGMEYWRGRQSRVDERDIE